MLGRYDRGRRTITVERKTQAQEPLAQALDDAFGSKTRAKLRLDPADGIDNKAAPLGWQRLEKYVKWQP